MAFGRVWSLDSFVLAVDATFHRRLDLTIEMCVAVFSRANPYPSNMRCKFNLPDKLLLFMYLLLGYFESKFARKIARQSSFANSTALVRSNDAAA